MLVVFPKHMLKIMISAYADGKSQQDIKDHLFMENKLPNDNGLIALECHCHIH